MKQRRREDGEPPAVIQEERRRRVDRMKYVQQSNHVGIDTKHHFEDAGSPGADGFRWPGLQIASLDHLKSDISAGK